MIGLYFLMPDKSLEFRALEGEIAGAVEVWPLRSYEDRFDFYRFLVEAAALGADRKRIEALKEKWNVVDLDGLEFAKRSGLTLWQDKDRHGEVWFASTGTPPLAFGPKAFDAIVDLYRKTLEANTIYKEEGE